MIHYALTCAAGHDFDGWFAGSAAFDSQCAGGLLECPSCATTDVRRALMAPAVSHRAARPVAKSTDKPPAEMLAALQKLRDTVERHCDYVGAGFAAVARQMHDGTTATRAIYGQTTPAEAEALRDDGIEIGVIPWVGRADS